MEIWYFSGTGNSYAAACALQQQLPGAELRGVTAGGPKPEGAMVLVFPVYYHGMPMVVRDFLRHSDLSGVTTVDAVATLGGAIPGGAFAQIRKELRPSGKRLRSGHYVRMPNNYMLMSDVRSPEMVQKLLTSSGAKLLAIAEGIRGGRASAPVEWTGPLNHLIYSMYDGKGAQLDRKFTADAACNGCSSCERVCKFGNIRMEGGKPVWQHQCQMCLACMNYCPKKAIQYGNGTAKRGRYHHPEVSLSQYTRI